ncbi:MAG: bacteriocin family protein [Actinobacteria bacterium]|nr:bacteriocin family protein [Actinomycetota bacterium]
MNHLQRELAPVPEAAWGAIEQEASRALRHFLTARRLLDFSGPHGWEHFATSLGRAQSVTESPVSGVEARTRIVRPLVELRTPFTMNRDELDAIERGALSPDLDAVTDAARRAALAEDNAVFHGFAAGGIDGIVDLSPHSPLAINDDYNRYPGTVARAVAVLREAGVEGPYAIALGPRCYTGVIETTEHGGYPVLEHIRTILGGPVAWAPAVDGAVVVSQRGGDYEIVCGQDFSIGYTSHDDRAVQLYLEESLTLRIAGPEAAVRLYYPS